MIAKKDYHMEKSLTPPPTISTVSQARKISWIVALIIIILSVFIAIVCTAIYTKQPDLPIEYDYVIKNWSVEPINSISPSANGCEEYFTSYNFPGTVDGCDCRTSPSAKYGNSIFDEQCTSEQVSNGCKVVNSTPQNTFTQWKLQNQILQLCIKRVNGFNYMKSDCSVVGYRRCGTAQGDTTNTNMFCLPSSTQCPINSIVYGATAPDNNYISIIDVGGGQKIFTSNQDLNAQPIAFSHISRGSGECKDFKNYHYVDPNMKEYVLMRGKENTCTLDQTDTRFKKLFQITESEYFSANQYDSKISSLPSYPLTQNMQYYFLTRSYIPWKQLGECRYTHMPYFIDLKSKADSVSNLWVGCIIVNWFVAVLYGGIASALRLKLEWKIKNWIIIPTIILLLAQTIITVITFALAADNNKNIKDMNDASCSDEQTNGIINTYSNDYNSSVLTYQIILLVFVLVLNIFTLFFMKTIFIIVRAGGDKNSVLPQSSSRLNSKNKGNSGKHQDYDNELLEDRGQIIGGFDNTYQPNGQDGNTMYPPHESGSEGYSHNINGNTIQQETVNIPLVIKANDDLEGNKQKGVLKKGGQPQQGKSVQILQINNQNGNGNIKSTKFDDNHYNSQFDKNKELENLYASNANTVQSINQPGKNASMLSVNPSQVRAINNTQSSLQQGQGNGKTMDTIEYENNDKFKFNTVRDNKNKSEMQLQILSANNKNYQSHFTSTPAKDPTPTQAQLNIQRSEQVIESLANMELLDNNEWEFEIDDYVKKHREQQKSHNRIGGGYEIGKPREKYLQHKFQRSHTRKVVSGNSIEFDNELASPEKIKSGLNPTQNLISPQITNNNFGSTNSLNQALQGNITENAEESERDDQQNVNKLP